MKKAIILAVVAVIGLMIVRAGYSQETAPSEQKAAQKVLRVHQVKAGENLHLLSAYYYGDARQWRKIWELNKKEIKNPNRINVGQMIKVEVDPGWSPKFDLDKFVAENAGKTPGMKKVATKAPTVERTFEEVKPLVVPRLLEGGTPKEGSKPEGKGTPPSETEGK